MGGLIGPQTVDLLSPGWWRAILQAKYGASATLEYLERAIPLEETPLTAFQTKLRHLEGWNLAKKIRAVP